MQKGSQDILVNFSFCVPQENNMDLEQHEDVWQTLDFYSNYPFNLLLERFRSMLSCTVKYCTMSTMWLKAHVTYVLTHNRGELQCCSCLVELWEIWNIHLSRKMCWCGLQVPVACSTTSFQFGRKYLTFMSIYISLALHENMEKYLYEEAFYWPYDPLLRS